MDQKYQQFVTVDFELAIMFTECEMDLENIDERLIDEVNLG